MSVNGIVGSIALKQTASLLNRLEHGDEAAPDMQRDMASLAAVALRRVRDVLSSDAPVGAGEKTMLQALAKQLRVRMGQWRRRSPREASVMETPIQETVRLLGVAASWSPGK
ncbi:MAG: hypothetical protein IKI72_02000 [Bacteroidales bacterium]|nr:hypothetical protein [Bacteroidales bacterium]